MTPTTMTSQNSRFISKMLLAAMAFGFLFIATISFAGNSGSWTSKYQDIKGQWTIVHDADGAKLVLGDDFKTRNAPDLKFILSNTSVDDMNGDNAIKGAVIIAPLKSAKGAKGAQTYQLPKNFSDFSTLALLCEQYSKLWGATDISSVK